MHKLSIEYSLRKISVCVFAFMISFTVLIGFNIDIVDARGNGGTIRNCRYTHYCNYGVLTKNGTNYNVQGWATYTRKCGQNSFPSWGCNFVKNEIMDRLGPASLSATWGLACGNTHGFTASLVSVNGSCGTATNTPIANFPVANLCNTGTVSGTSTSPTSHNWTCLGLNGGSNVACSAPRTSSFGVNCTLTPATGIINSNVAFTANITGTSTPATSFVYTWRINGVASTTATTRFFTNRWSVASTTLQVEVTARRGTFTQKAFCPFNRVQCTAGQVSCMDVAPVESYACAAATTSCPTSACGTTTAKELDISKDYVLPAGTVLATSTPSAGYISTNLLCKSDNVLKVVPTSSWNFSPSYSTWRWECQHPSAISIATCKARCATGKFYCGETNSCVDEGSTCNCPLEGTLIPGPPVMVDQAEHCLNEDGTCFSCDKVINYFRLNPDTIEKNQNLRLCKGFWTTNDIPLAKRPVNTASTQVVCSMKSATTSYSVISDMPTGGAGQPLPISTYALTCTQQYQLTTEPGIWKDLQSHTLDAKCLAAPSLLER